MIKGYSQSCPVAQTLEIVGEKWTILILRDLLTEGPRKFHDFEVSLRGIAPNTLSARLKSLLANEVIESQLYSGHPPRAEYRLTKMGKDLGRIVSAMRDWGLRYGDIPRGPPTEKQAGRR